MFRKSVFVPLSCFALVLLLFTLGPALRAADASRSDAPKPGEPTDPKARKTYAGAMDWEMHRHFDAAISDYRKANKQDGGHCSECLRRAYLLARKTGAFKDEVEVAREMLTQAATNEEKADAHYWLGLGLQAQGIDKKKEECFSESCDEFKTAFGLDPRLADAHYAHGVSLAYLHQDDAARAEFAAFLQRDRPGSTLHPRAERFVNHIELARATMAPMFSLTTLDGRKISMDGLAGKVVLIDFWATWCGSCREALPRIRKIAQKFDGQPLVVLSISLDKDDARWKDFVAKNGMTWMQYRDGGLNGAIARLFNVDAIPATFTIDADGVLEDQHVGDADIEGKLKKLIVRAAEVASRAPATGTAGGSAETGKSAVGEKSTPSPN